MQENMENKNKDIVHNQKKIAFIQCSGPLPDPNDFKMYGEVLKDAPERILKMAEKEQEYRFKREFREITLATSIVFFCLIVCIFAMFLNFPYVAGVIGGTTILGVLSIILLKKPHKK